MEDQVSLTATSVASYSTSGGLILFGMTASDAASVVVIVSGLIGITLGLATFAINWYYQHKRSK